MFRASFNFFISPRLRVPEPIVATGNPPNELTTAQPWPRLSTFSSANPTKQHQNGKTMEALDTLSGAFRLDPRNPQAHYQRATIFMSLDRPEEALCELEKVRSAAPKESSVHFNMGKVYKRLGQPARAMRCFLTALDLDPKDNNLIKAAMDRLDEPDVEDEVSVF